MEGVMSRRQPSQGQPGNHLDRVVHLQCPKGHSLGVVQEQVGQVLFINGPAVESRSGGGIDKLHAWCTRCVAAGTAEPLHCCASWQRVHEALAALRETRARTTVVVMA
jgi:hypothetical protein